MSDPTDPIHRLDQLLRSDARAALRQARELLDAQEHDVDSVSYQRLRLVKGAAQSQLGETEDGARILREVRAWAEEHGEPGLLASTHRKLSALFRRIGDPALMLEHAVTAVDLLGPDADPLLRADHVVGLADALGASASYDESIERYHEANLLAESIGDRYQQIAVLNNLAFTLYDAGRTDEAVVAAEQLQEELRRDGRPLLTHYGDTIARAFMAVGRLAEAAAVLEPLCSTADTGEDCDGLVMALLALAEVHRRAGAFSRAQHTLDRACRLAEEFALNGLMILLMQEQAELFAAEGRFEEAFETYRDFHRADTELRAIERDGRARMLNAIFEATEARRSSDYFRELSVRDPLTGLHNRRHLDARLDELLAGVAAAETCLTLGLLDLDHFKRINDTRSHAVGDDVLRRVALLLQQAAAEVEDSLVVRMGGEEFLLLLPGVSGTAAYEHLESLRRRIAEHDWDLLTDGIAVTASIGVAEAPRDASEEAKLLAIADEHLYRAKRAGRNQVQGALLPVNPGPDAG